MVSHTSNVYSNLQMSDFIKQILFQCTKFFCRIFSSQCTNTTSQRTNKVFQCTNRIFPCTKKVFFSKTKFEIHTLSSGAQIKFPHCTNTISQCTNKRSLLQHNCNLVNMYTQLQHIVQSDCFPVTRNLLLLFCPMKPSFLLSNCRYFS